MLSLPRPWDPLGKTTKGAMDCLTGNWGIPGRAAYVSNDDVEFTCRHCLDETPFSQTMMKYDGERLTTSGDALIVWRCPDGHEERWHLIPFFRWNKKRVIRCLRCGHEFFGIGREVWTPCPKCGPGAHARYQWIGLRQVGEAVLHHIHGGYGWHPASVKHRFNSRRKSRRGDLTTQALRPWFM